MADLIYMMNQLVDKDGKILVEGIQNSVAPVTPEELESYKVRSFLSLEYFQFMILFKFSFLRISTLM